MSLRAVTVASLAAVPGLVHGFEQRVPGAAPETREASRLRLTRELLGPGRLLFLRQVHGAVVVEAPWSGEPRADAGVCARPGLLLGIETADCLPILLVEPRRRVVAAAHAGWRGTAASVACRAVDALVALGCQPDQLLAALGPAIGPCCYEVGSELQPAFGAEAAFVFRAVAGGRPRLDLRVANERQLVRAGISPTAISHVRHCTACRADDYPSYRREGKGCGRMVSYVGFRGDPPDPGV